jgi:hypothetical protein
MNSPTRLLAVICAGALALNSTPASSATHVNVAGVPVVIRGIVRMTTEDDRAPGSGLAGVTVTAATGGAVVGTAVTDSTGAYSMTVRGGGLSGCLEINGQPVIISCTPVTTTFLLKTRKDIGAGDGLGRFSISPAIRLLSVSGRPSGADAVLTQDYTAKRPAIVFVSGYLLDLPKSRCPQTFVDRLGVIRNYTPGDCPDTAFLSTNGGSDASSVPTALANAGYHVQRVMLDVNVFGSASIRNQVPVLTTGIDRAKRATGQSKVIVISHSTGTIVARRYIESSEYRGDVSHYFSFGGPHRGWHFEALAGAFIAASTIGGFALTASSVGAEGSVAATATFCALHKAACDMSRSSMASFNNDFRANPNVTYHMIHGDMLRTVPCSIFGVPTRCDDPDNASVNPLFRVVDLANTLAGSPANDGLIPSDGINAVQGSHDRLLTYDTHMLQVGPRYYFKRSGDGREGEGWTSCILPVLIDGTKDTCGSVRNANVPLEHASHMQQRQEMDALQTVRPLQGVLAPGQTITRPVALIDSPVSAAFVATWQGGAAELTLIGPDGAAIMPALAATFPLSVQHALTDTASSYVLSGTLPGVYTMVFTATGAPVTYTLAAAFDSALTFDATRNRNWYAPGGTAVLSATLAGLPVSADSVRALIRRADGVTEAIQLAPIGGGTYSANYTVPNASGYVEATIVAEGIANGTAFERARAFNFQVYPASFKIADGYADVATREALTISVNINPLIGGPVRVSGTLVDATTGAQIKTVAVSAELVTGTLAAIPLVFDGEALRAAGFNGPYRLARVLVTDERETTLVSDDQFDVFTTRSYRATDFGFNKVYLPTALSEGS